MTIKLYDPELAKRVTLTGQKILRELMEKLFEQGYADAGKELKNEITDYGIL